MHRSKLRRLITLAARPLVVIGRDILAEYDHDVQAFGTMSPQSP
jgi:hypothetical protein